MTTRRSTQERKAQIADAAIKIIGEMGLRAFTVAHIAQEVGIKDGSIFRHFKNKNEIVLAALDRLEGFFEESSSDLIDNPLDRLGVFYVNKIKVFTSQPGIQALVFSDQLIHAGGQQALARVRAFRSKVRKFINECLNEAREKKLVREDLDTDDLLVLFQGAMMSLLVLAREKSLKGSPEVHAKRVWKTFLAMIKA